MTASNEVKALPCRWCGVETVCHYSEGKPWAVCLNPDCVAFDAEMELKHWNTPIHPKRAEAEGLTRARPASSAQVQEVADRLQRMADASTSSLLAHNLMEMHTQLEAALQASPVDPVDKAGWLTREEAEARLKDALATEKAFRERGWDGAAAIESKRASAFRMALHALKVTQ